MQGNQIEVAADLAHRYLWNPAAVDQLLADEQIATPAAAGEVLWALTDHLGSVRDVVGSNGTLRIHKNFDSFGNVLGETHYSSSGTLVTSGAGYVDTAFGFTGRLLDKATGLQNNLHRWYDASNGRWLSEDPIGFAAGDANLYCYVGNAPTIYTDPSGLANFWNPITWGINDPHQSWGSFFNPLNSQLPSTIGAGALGTAQGCANVANAGTDTAIGVANTPAFVWNNTAGWVAPNAPYIPSPDWSNGLITDEGGLHGWSKGAGAVGIGAGLGAYGAARAAAARAAATGSNVAIIEQEGSTVLGSFPVARGEARFVCEIAREGDTLIARGAHIEGNATWKEVVETARRFGREQGAKRVIIEGGKRSTGARPGHFPRPITIEVP